MVVQKTIHFRTTGRGSQDITAEIDKIIGETGIEQGICNIFVLHTSASLILCENADPTVRMDLETLMARLVPDGDPEFRHTLEGSDDMAAHARTVLTDSNINLPVTHGRCALGTWQGVFLWEHRVQPHNRKVIVTVYGD